MGDVIKFSNSTMINPDGSLNKEGHSEALQHLSKCANLFKQRIEDEEIDGSLVLLFKDGELVEDIMAGNIRSSSLLFCLEFIKYQLIIGAENFTTEEEVTDDD